MEFGQGSGRDLVSRRGALALFGAIAAMRHAGAAEQAIMQPVALDHVNIRVPNVARTAQFYMALVDTPVLRSQTLRAQPDSPPGEGFFLRFGDGYLAISQAFAPDLPGLDHYSRGCAITTRRKSRQVCRTTERRHRPDHQQMCG